MVKVFEEITERSVIEGIKKKRKRKTGTMLAVFKNLRVFCRKNICLSSIFPEGRAKMTGIKHQNIKKHCFDKIEGRFLKDNFSGYTMK